MASTFISYEHLWPPAGNRFFNSRAPLNGHLKGRPNICVWLGILLLRLGHWFCLLFNFLKALPKIWDWILIFSLSMICYFPISEERKVKLRNIEVSHRESHLRILVSCLCNYFRMGCFQDPPKQSLIRWGAHWQILFSFMCLFPSYCVWLPYWP